MHVIALRLQIIPECTAVLENPQVDWNITYLCVLKIATQKFTSAMNKPESEKTRHVK